LINGGKFKLILVVGRKGTTTARGDLEGNIFTNQGKKESYEKVAMS
jgi:hypothetical protein